MKGANGYVHRPDPLSTAVLPDGSNGTFKMCLEGKWKVQYDNLALEQALKSPLSVTVITANASAAMHEACQQLNKCRVTDLAPALMRIWVQLFCPLHGGIPITAM